MEDPRAENALRRALRNIAEQVGRGAQAHGVDIQTPTWEDRARTPFRSILDGDGDEVGAYGIGGYDVAVYG